MFVIFAPNAKADFSDGLDKTPIVQQQKGPAKIRGRFWTIQILPKPLVEKGKKSLCRGLRSSPPLEPRARLRQDLGLKSQWALEFMALLVAATGMDRGLVRLLWGW